MPDHGWIIAAKPVPRYRTLGRRASRGVTAAASSEGEGIGAGAGVEEADLEIARLHAAGLPDELIEAGLRDGAVAGGVGVGAVAVARRLAIDRHLEADRLVVAGRAENEMQVAGVEPV